MIIEDIEREVQSQLDSVAAYRLAVSHDGPQEQVAALRSVLSKYAIAFPLYMANLDRLNTMLQALLRGAP